MSWTIPGMEIYSVAGQVLFFGSFLALSWSVSRRTKKGLLDVATGKALASTRLTAFEGALVLLGVLGGAGLFFLSFDVEAMREAATAYRSSR